MQMSRIIKKAAKELVAAHKLISYREKEEKRNEERDSSKKGRTDQGPLGKPGQDAEVTTSTSSPLCMPGAPLARSLDLDPCGVNLRPRSEVEYP